MKVFAFYEMLVNNGVDESKCSAPTLQILLSKKDSLYLRLKMIAIKSPFF